MNIETEQFNSNLIGTFSIKSKKTNQYIISLIFSNTEWRFDENRTNRFVLEAFYQRGIRVPKEERTNFRNKTVITTEDALFPNAFINLVVPKKYPSSRYFIEIINDRTASKQR